MPQLQIPPVTLEDLQSFQAKHFLGHSTQTLACDYPTAPAEDDYYAYEEEYDDDDLGYYPDGVKCTLTDEQIRIFRHSEIHALQRERRLKEESKEEEEEEAGEQVQVQAQNGNAKRKRRDEDEDEDGGGSKEQTEADGSAVSTSLDYDDGQEPRKIQRPSSNAPFAGRRIISYED